MKLRFAIVAVLPFILSGCAEIISFGVGFGAGYFTGQYMTKSEMEEAQRAKAARNRGQQGNPAMMRGPGGQPGMQPQAMNPYSKMQGMSGMGYAQPYGYYYQTTPQMQQQWYAQQAPLFQQAPSQPRPYGLPAPQAMRSAPAKPMTQSNNIATYQPRGANDRYEPYDPPMMKDAPVEDVLETPMPEATPTPSPAPQPDADVVQELMQPPPGYATEEPEMLPPTPAPMPQVMMTPPAVPAIPAPTPPAGYDVAPIPVAPLQPQAPAAPAPLALPPLPPPPGL